MKYRAVIDDVVSTFSDRIHSHKSSWPRMQRCLVQDYFDSTPKGGEARLLGPKDAGETAEAGTWLVSHSMEFNGEGYNLFGGLTDELIERVERFVDFRGKIFSLERPLPDISALLGCRDKTGKHEALWQELSSRSRTEPMLSHRDILEWTKPVEHVVLGDSHAIAHYQRGALVSRTDGLTLHGLLERGLYQSLQQVVPYPIKKLTVCAGNIDIRHHLLRQEDPKAAVDHLVNVLSDQIAWLCNNEVIEDFEIVMPLPIEHEERRIPKTGFYKGTPFYGTVEDRDNIRFYMAEQLYGRFMPWVFEWPERWYRDPYYYADAYMEKPGSVHLSPAYHRWDYESNMPNSRLAEEYG